MEVVGKDVVRNEVEGKAGVRIEKVRQYRGRASKQVRDHANGSEYLAYFLTTYLYTKRARLQTTLAAPKHRVQYRKDYSL